MDCPFKIGEFLSAEKAINLGTVQGSGTGPSNYIVMASDLRVLSRLFNKLFKYADDTTLLVPEHTDVQLEEEFAALKAWAENNKMILNVLKTKEIVFHRPDARSYIPPSKLTDIERVNCIKLLGLFISDTLGFEEHVKYVLTVCGQRCYLLKALRWQGLSHYHVNNIFQSLIISRLSYALSAWGGFLTKGQINKINVFLSRAHRFNYCTTAITFSEILKDADSVLFKRVLDSKHCLHNLLPPERAVPMILRSQCLQLPVCRYNLYKHSFIIRSVFNKSY